MLFASTAAMHADKSHQALTTLIQQEADRCGGLTFARFMELALYAPGLGYYERAGQTIGRRGDFFTSVSVGRLFGELLACQFAAWLEKLAAPRPVVVEAGAHDGRLALDLLNEVTDHHPALGSRLEYWLIEPSPTRQTWQSATLGAHSHRCRWFQSWTELASFCDSTGRPLTGVVFANELLDALPIHCLRWRKSDQTWCELGVQYSGNSFIWAEQPLSLAVEAYAAALRGKSAGITDELLWPNLPAALLNALPDGFTTEVCPAAETWWSHAARTLHQGWLVTLDYGLQAAEFFTPQRANGNLRSYHQHQLTANVLANPGQQDLTGHVNLDALKSAGMRAGLNTEANCSQSDFLTGIVRTLWPIAHRPFSIQQARQFQTLTHPDQLGRAFRVLAQSRGVNAGS